MMLSDSFNTPILLLIFNRPDTTIKVFEQIRIAKPMKLYIAADGPRQNKPLDEGMCKAAREVVANIDWPCDVKRLFRDRNLGCRIGVTEAIAWFFENEKEGIILEDDCVPNIDFFIFCKVMLDRYREDDRVMHIGGSNFQFGNKIGDGGYYFSRIPHIWGWATWREAWQKYDLSFNLIDQFIFEGQVNNLVSDRIVQQFWERSFKKAKKTLDGWDFEWTYTLMKDSGLSIIPNENLIVNIGFNENATHGSFIFKKIREMKLERLKSLNPPLFLIPNQSADEYTIKVVFEATLMRRVINLFRKFFLKISTQ